MSAIEHYSDFWKKQVIEYGLGDGIDAIIKILQQLPCNNYFEVGIGTGWPIAKSLIDTGRTVYGCDLSSQSVLSAINDYPKLFGNVFQGAIQNVDKLKTQEFDCVYCIRSSWYIKKFPQETMKLMIDHTKPGGYIVFNVINRDSSLNKKSINKKIGDFISIIVHRCICALKVIVLDEDYSGRLKGYYYTDREIRQNLGGVDEIRVISVNQLIHGLDVDYDFDTQKILYIIKKL